MLTQIVAKTGGAIASFPYGSRWITAGRALVALSQLSIILITPLAALFVPVIGQGVKPTCDGVWRATAYCITPGSSEWLPTVLLTLVFCSVVAGLYPRITSILHYWATLSLSLGISLPDGGEAAAQAFALFFVLTCAGDGRRNGWRSASRTGPPTVLDALSWAGHWGLRLQVAWIYTNAAVTKLKVNEWQDGTAMYYIVRGELFGAGDWVRELALWVTAIAPVELALTWGAIGIELCIAFVIVSRRDQGRLVALGLAVMLHGGIIMMIGLWSFGLVMIGGVCAAMAGAVTCKEGSTAPRRANLPAQRVTLLEKVS